MRKTAEKVVAKGFNVLIDTRLKYLKCLQDGWNNIEQQKEKKRYLIVLSHEENVV